MLKTALATVLATASFCALAQHSAVTHIGQPPQEVAKSPRSFSATTDLIGAAKLIVPSGWTAFAKADVDGRRSSAVDVSAGEMWITALERWATKEGMSAKLDWKNKRVYLDQVSVPQGFSIKAQQEQGAEAKPYVVNQPSPTWTILTSDVRLEKTLERWAQQAGYTLIWDADRHVLITAEDSFTGTFEEAMNRVLSSPAIRDSDYPLEAVIYSNNPPVLRITGLGEQTSKE